MVCGHTHFSPDRGFSWINQKLNMEEAFNLQEFASSVRKVNKLLCCKIMATFKDIKKIFARNLKQVNGISQFAEILLLKSEPNKWFASSTLLQPSVTPRVWRYSESGEIWRNETPLGNLIAFPCLPKKPIDQNKQKDITTLFDKGIIPEKYRRDYY
eukprot:gb/GECH01005523.1/.p1 GENE.gb/GECH01005523.1/~~gb/GECH01005523.1/.p1  ORF type:complete len:156 (+),score=14.29 gb/GECH01005523.1/:1-468(+)